MPNPQRKVDRLTSKRLTPLELLKVYPLSFATTWTLTAMTFLSIWLHSDALGIITVVVGIVAFFLAPVLFEGFWNNADRAAKLRDKRRAVIERRGIHRGRPRVIAVPNGENVTIHTWTPQSWGAIDHAAVTFHAETQDAEAQKYVAEFKARDFTTGKPRPSSEAAALAKVLNS